MIIEKEKRRMKKSSIPPYRALLGKELI